ncbi:SLAM family member 8-like [Ambystoma mexicanum]|uniref:SLAM family member 8-like n=1 Tax=Ambystoma mexicanum TaxID=8296 RepID=UPI0037E79468
MAARLVLALVTYKAWLPAARGSLHLDSAVGESVSLSPRVPMDSDINGVIWRHISSTEILIAMFFKGSPATIYQSPFFGRARLSPNFTLEVATVELGDSGTFQAQLVDTEGHIETRTVSLAVYELVNKPIVQVFATRPKESHYVNSSCEVFLSCSVEKGTGVSYSWYRTDRVGGILVNDSRSILDSGRILKLRLDSSDHHAVYCCTAFNPVSQESTSVAPWDSCPSMPGAEGAEGPVCEYKYFVFIVLPLLAALVFGVIIWIVRFAKCSGKQRKKAAADGETEETAV